MKKLIIGLVLFLFCSTCFASAVYKYKIFEVRQGGNTTVYVTVHYYRDDEQIGEKIYNVEEDLSLTELKAIAVAGGEEFKTMGGIYERLKAYEGVEVTY